MKKCIAILLALAVVLAVSGCGNKTADAEKSQPEGEASGSVSAETSAETSAEPAEDNEAKAAFVIAFDEDDMPFSYRDEKGELVGLNVDVAREACKRCGWEMMAEGIDWTKKDEILAGGTVDCVWGKGTESEIFGSDSDLYWATYGEIYVDAMALIHSDVDILSQLKGKRIMIDPEARFAIEGSDASEECVALLKDAASVSIADSAEAAYQALFDNACDAVFVNAVSDAEVDFEKVSDNAEADEDGYVIKTLYTSEDEDNAEVLYYRGVGCCFANYSEDYDSMNNTLYSMCEDGSIAEMVKLWDNTEWGSLTKRFYVEDYSSDEDEEDISEEEDEETIELTEEELAELFGDSSIIDITDEDYKEESNP